MRVVTKAAILVTCFASAGVLAFNGSPGWGWFLSIGALLAYEWL